MASRLRFSESQQAFLFNDKSLLIYTVMYAKSLSYIFLCFAWLFVGSQTQFNKAYFVIKSVEKTKVILTSLLHFSVFVFPAKR